MIITEKTRQKDMAGTSRTALLFCMGTVLICLFRVDAQDPAASGSLPNPNPSLIPLPKPKIVKSAEPMIGGSGTTIAGVTDTESGHSLIPLPKPKIVKSEEHVIGGSATTIAGVTDPNPSGEGEVENDSNGLPSDLDPEVVIVGHRRR